MPEKLSERLLIFTRYPEPGRTKTRLIPTLGEQGAADLQRCMTEHLIAKACELLTRRAVSIEIHYDGGNETLMRTWLGSAFTYHPQHRGDIGRRMRLAVDEAFQSGCTAAVLIGTDIPGISIAILENAFADLEKNDLVLGPAGDGGYYLIGIKYTCWPHANPGLFEGIKWGTDQVLTRTLAVAEDLTLDYSLLETLQDIDRPEDLHVWQQVDKKSATHARRACISIIIPTLNEADHILSTLAGITDRTGVQVIVVDGGSSDDTPQLARSMGATVLASRPSKAAQMNAGASAASGDVLLFLHADTKLPENFEKAILSHIDRSGVTAGAFLLGIDADASGLRFIERVANWRSRRLQTPYGDQGIFVSKRRFDEIGGYPDIPIMEDFALIRRLRKKGKIVIVNESVRTSPRRWLQVGIFKTWLLNLLILVAYHLGVSPQRLAHWYHREKGKSLN